MMKLLAALSLLLLSRVAQSQDTASGDLHSLTFVSSQTPAEIAVNIGEQFLGRPYVPYTLDQNPTEQLVVNLREFDCTTYLETVLALSLAWSETADKPNPVLAEQAFRNYLTRLRYRNGRIEGYASRLHYFSDWLRENQRKGLVADVSNELPGHVVVAKPISYMTTLLHKYPQLRDPGIFKQIALTEASLSQQSFSFIPTKNIRQAESQIQQGDIIMMIAARPGLDMKHVGLAVRQPNGRMHLLHASSDLGMVVVTSYPISDYVLWHKHLSGIRVARLCSSGVTTTTIGK